MPYITMPAGWRAAYLDGDKVKVLMPGEDVTSDEVEKKRALMQKLTEQYGRQA